MSRQAFYDWQRRQLAGPFEAEVTTAGLVQVMREIHYEFDEIYGSPRMTVELTNRGRLVNDKRVERPMRVPGISLVVFRVQRVV